MGEADDLMKDGAKALTKTSFFGKAKPDYDDALNSFEQAANLYRNDRQYARAAEALQQAAECHRNLNSMFLAAKALETAANVLSQNMNDPQRAGTVYQQASQYFLVQGSPDRAGEMLEKAAKAFETVDASKAIEYYTESCTLYEEEDRLRFGVDTFKRAIGFCLRSSKLDQAIALSIRLESAYLKIDNQPLYNRQALTNVILFLSKGDQSAAQRQYEMSLQKNNRFEQTEEGQVTQDLLTACQTGDTGIFEGMQRSPAIRFLDNDVGKLFKNVVTDLSQAAPQGGHFASNEGNNNEHASGAQDLRNLQDEVEEEGFL